MESTERPLTTGKVAARLGVSAPTVRDLIDAGKFPGAFKVGTDWRVPAADVDAYIAANTVKPAVPATQQGDQP